MRRRTAALAVAVAALLTGCANGTASVSARDGATVQIVPPQEREAGPEIAGQTVDGEDNLVLPEDFDGKVVVVNAWGSWCPPCREEADDLERVYRKRRDEGVAFVGVTVKDNAAAARNFQKRHGISYPSIHPGEEVLLGFHSSLPAHQPPVTWVIDREGRVASRVVGAVTETTLDGLVADVLAEAS